jgi:hypothetical protein
MEVDAIRIEVEKILQDDDYSGDWIVSRFNEALLLIATVCRIPGLQETMPLTTVMGAANLIMPESYLHDLFLVTTTTYPKGIVICPNIKDFNFRKGTGSNNSGLTQMVSLDALVLSYWPIPDAVEILNCSYYAKPAVLDAGGDFPSYIPETLQRPIFQNYVLKEAYMQIEDGTDGKSFNTEKYNGLAMAGIQNLVNLFPNAPKMKPEIRRSSSFF